MSDTHLTALQLANTLGGEPAAVVARAKAYHDFLTSAPTAAAAVKGATANKPPATGKAAATNGAAAPPKTATPPATGPKKANPPPKQVGAHSYDEVKAAIQKVIGAVSKQAALEILDSEAGGVRSLKDMKPENYDAVWEACQAEINSGEGDAAKPPAQTDEIEV